MKQTKEIEKEVEFQEIIHSLIQHPTVQEMRNYRQHFQTSCYEHCYQAAYYCYKIAKKFHWDYRSVTRAAMLHDLFLYDWRLRQDGRKGLHAFTHPKTALTNATKLFTLNKKEKDIILKHMWPVTFFHFPKYKESYIITLVDKYCAIQESINAYRSKSSIQKLYRYAYVFLSMLIILR